MIFGIIILFLLDLPVFPIDDQCRNPVSYRFYSKDDILFYTHYFFPDYCSSNSQGNFSESRDIGRNSSFVRPFEEKEIYRNRIPETAGYFIDYCLGEIRNISLKERNVSLDIFTTIDPEYQKFIEDRAKIHFIEKKKQDSSKQPFDFRNTEIAAIALDVTTGGIRGMIGGKNYSAENKYNRAVSSRRQISSTIKPFLYALAIESKGFLPDSLFEDKPVSMLDREGLSWKPKNFYPYYLGKVTLKKAIVVSINTVAVQLIQMTGVHEMAGLSRRIFGIEEVSPGNRIMDNPSLSLGSIDLTPLELAAGYLVLANGGIRTPVFSVRRISDRKGVTLADFEPVSGDRMKRIFSRTTVSMIIDFLKTVVTEGTAKEFYRRNLDFEIAGKSGSSPSDSWFAGFTTDTIDFNCENKYALRLHGK
ncbi:MAG: hypothetical protein K8R21_02180 [Leptospira sp.]|nr:hypothetical protein [Leptospira sp.]